MSVSVQLLDCVHGSPAAGVAVRLERDAGDGWCTVRTGGTNSAGRCELTDEDVPGPRRIEVATDGYFVALGLRPYYRGIVVALPRAEAADLELSLSVSPFAYTVTLTRVPAWSAAAGR